MLLSCLVIFCIFSCIFPFDKFGSFKITNFFPSRFLTYMNLYLSNAVTINSYLRSENKHKDRHIWKDTCLFPTPCAHLPPKNIKGDKRKVGEILSPTSWSWQAWREIECTANRTKQSNIPTLLCRWGVGGKQRCLLLNSELETVQESYFFWR